MDGTDSWGQFRPVFSKLTVDYYVSQSTTIHSTRYNLIPHKYHFNHSALVTHSQFLLKASSSSVSPKAITLQNPNSARPSHTQIPSYSTSTSFTFYCPAARKCIFYLHNLGNGTRLAHHQAILY
ncbi:hypothetical protein COCVIDRAFT_14352 [Bipolaris victoriae FI3]|uniref:Uncharacterized protein n=2 Tax=Bipolaris TaxID=33194 RepID=W6YIH3_COCC2|nr:uncharacterized protein COCCADRAFT_23041 [Bipolaris zeicola 26-R-13]XP_014558502.1 hypothetical protein COCVIDRAFT_14352 [Bipolaris victoriae FI3]EUC37325.1 hypothetical protein COCCADRAFT_23041 [Bipolaris zeicola 26-R-13]